MSFIYFYVFSLCRLSSQWGRWEQDGSTQGSAMGKNGPQRGSGSSLGKTRLKMGFLHSSVTQRRAVEGHIGDNILQAVDCNRPECRSLISRRINTSSYALPGAQTVAATRLKALFFANRCNIHQEKHCCHSSLNSNSAFLVQWLLLGWEIQEGDKSPSYHTSLGSCAILEAPTRKNWLGKVEMV